MLLLPTSRSRSVCVLQEKPACGRCATEGHVKDNCQAKTPNCAACNGQHETSSSSCTAWKEECATAKLKQQHKISYAQALQQLCTQQQEDEKEEDQEEEDTEEEPEDSKDIPNNEQEEEDMEDDSEDSIPFPPEKKKKKEEDTTQVKTHHQMWKFTTSLARRLLRKHIIHKLVKTWAEIIKAEYQEFLQGQRNPITTL